MKKWTLRILLCLILGVVTTVGVAWGCSQVLILLDHANGSLEDGRWSVFYATAGEMDEGPKLEWLLGAIEWIAGERKDRGLSGTASFDIGWYSGFASDWVGLHTDNWREGQRTEFVAVIHRAGWPMHALGLDRRGIDTGQSAVPLRDIATEIAWSIETWPTRLGEDTYVPLRPLFPGFLINTLFYAAIWFGLLFGFTTLRRTIRRRRGQCPMCAYYLRGNTPHPQPLSQGERGVRGCPECGWNRATDHADSA